MSKCGPGLPALATEAKTTHTITSITIMTMPLSQIVFRAMWKSCLLSTTTPQEVRVDVLNHVFRSILNNWLFFCLHFHASSPKKLREFFVVVAFTYWVQQSLQYFTK